MGKHSDPNCVFNPIKEDIELSVVKKKMMRDDGHEEEEEEGRQVVGHAVCFPTTAQSHIGAMLKLAKLLHQRGFHISFVNTYSNHQRILQATTSDASSSNEGFEFVSIPDARDTSLSVRVDYVRNGMEGPLLDLLNNLNLKHQKKNKKVSCIVADAYMTFSAGPVAHKLGIPLVHLWTIAASALMGFIQLPLLPLQDMSYKDNGNVLMDWVPGMQNARLSDLPGFIRTTEADELRFNLTIDALALSHHASATIIHTAEALEPHILNALSTIFPHPFYPIAPFHQLLLTQQQQHNHSSLNVACNLWKEDTDCLQWLDSKKPSSVIYVNFGSILFLTQQQLTEFAMGIANSKQPFLWIIRDDLCGGVLPAEFVEGTKERGFTASWCSQEQVLKHPAIGGFLSHCGWNSTLESLSAGVPMLCWPCSGDQFIDCRFICVEWEIGLEIESNVGRDNVERLVRELMQGDQGRRLRKRAMEWRSILESQTAPRGSSSLNLESFINQMLTK